MSERATERERLTDEERDRWLAGQIEQIASDHASKMTPTDERLIHEAARRLRASADAPTDELPPPWGEGVEMDADSKRAFGRMLDDATEPADATPDRGGERDALLGLTLGNAAHALRKGDVEDAAEHISYARELHLRGRFEATAHQEEGSDP